MVGLYIPIPFTLLSRNKKNTRFAFIFGCKMALSYTLDVISTARECFKMASEASTSLLNNSTSGLPSLRMNKDIKMR